jgi:hypothetical protein
MVADELQPFLDLLCPLRASWEGILPDPSRSLRNGAQMGVMDRIDMIHDTTHQIRFIHLFPLIAKLTELRLTVRALALAHS